MTSSLVNKFNIIKEKDKKLNGLEGETKNVYKVMKNRSLVVKNNLKPNELDIINVVLKNSKYKIRESIVLDTINIITYCKGETIVVENEDWCNLGIVLTGIVLVNTLKSGYIGKLKETNWFGNIKEKKAKGTMICLEEAKIAYIPYSYYTKEQKHVNEQDIFNKIEHKTNQLDEILFVPDKIGNGAFADVYKCKIQDNRYAVKRINKKTINESNSQKQLLNEIRVLQMIEHSQVLNLINVLQDDSNIYIITELIVCGDFFDYLTSYTLNEQDAMFYTANIIQILEYLHDKDIVYRDLKPENMVFMENGYIKLIDFGFAKCLKSGEKTNTILGTPEYMAPEIMMGKGYDKSVDWWALGIFTYELLYMDVPFGGDIYKLNKLAKEPIIYPNKKSLESNDFIDRLLHYNVNERLNNYNIRNHKWFLNKKFNWNKLYKYQYKPNYIPQKKKFSSFYIKYDKFYIKYDKLDKISRN